MFWVPGCEEEKVSGVLQLKAGQVPLLETAKFTYGGLRNMFPSIPKPDPDATAELRGEQVIKAMFAPARRVLHGHDEHGRFLTLIDCHSAHSQSTLAMVGHSYSCRAAISGAALSADDLKFDGLRLRFDHQDEWLNRYAFGRFAETRDDQHVWKRITKITIPFSDQLSIPLNLDGYAKSEFYLGWTMSPGVSDFHLDSRSYLDFEFTQHRSWDDVLEEIHRWRWFFSLATRTTADLVQVSVFRNEIRVPIGAERMEEMPVWLPRAHAEKVLYPKRLNREFHFTFDDVENTFAEVVRKWESIQKPWAAVLHRFFAIAESRGLWMNEEFLFLAQAIESLHRARTATSSDVSMAQAAKEAYLQSPAELQNLLGRRGTFVNQVHKSRNYWTHYGTPGHGDDPDILDDGPLIELNEKLRWVVEAAILKEIGIPDQCVARVWSRQWKLQSVQFQ